MTFWRLGDFKQVAYKKVSAPEKKKKTKKPKKAKKTKQTKTKTKIIPHIVFIQDRCIFQIFVMWNVKKQIGAAIFTKKHEINKRIIEGHTFALVSYKNSCTYIVYLFEMLQSWFLQYMDSTNQSLTEDTQTFLVLS